MTSFHTADFASGRRGLKSCVWLLAAGLSLSLGFRHTAGAQGSAGSGSNASSTAAASTDHKPTMPPTSVLGSAQPAVMPLSVYLRNDGRAVWRRVVRLSQQLDDADPDARAHAAYELGVMGPEAEAALRTLAELLDDESDAVRAYAAVALWQIDHQHELAVEILLELLHSDRPGAADLAAYSLGKIGPAAADALPSLRDNLAAADARSRLLLAEAIAKIDPQDQAAVEALAELLDSDDANTRLLAVYGLADLGFDDPQRVVPAVSAALEDEDDRVRAAAGTTLELFGAAPGGSSISGPSFKRFTTSRRAKRPIVWMGGVRQSDRIDRRIVRNVAQNTTLAPDQSRDARGGQQRAKPASASPSLHGEATAAEQQSAQGARQSSVGTSARRSATTDLVASGLNSENRRLIDRADAIPTRIRRQSQSAFDRGLMSLPDYADHLSIALRLKIALAEVADDDRPYKMALKEHASTVRLAAAKLREFSEPGAKGWVADLAYSRMLAADAEAALAAAHDDLAKQRAALARSRALADKQYESRLADFQIGLATLPQLARAASHLTSTTARPATLAEVDRGALAGLRQYRDRMREVVNQAELLNRRGAGLGREDRLLLARFELQRADATLDRAGGNDDAAAEHAKAAVDLAGRLFETQLKFYETGTASLFDLTRTWWQLQTLADSARQAELELPRSVERQQRARLTRLLRLAGDIKDRRGRNAADVSLVEGLEVLWAVDELRRASESATAQHDRKLN